MDFRNTIAKLEFVTKQHELNEDKELAAREIRKCQLDIGKRKVSNYVEKKKHWRKSSIINII